MKLAVKVIALFSSVSFLIPSLPMKAIAQTTTSNVVVNCLNAIGQMCEPGYSVSFTTANDWKLVSMKFTAPPTFCSALRLHVFLDGKLVRTTPFLGFAGNPATTGLIPLQSVRPGIHVLEVKAEGKTGGCNTGGLNGGSWAGTLQITSQ